MTTASIAVAPVAPRAWLVAPAAGAAVGLLLAAHQPGIVEATYPPLMLVVAVWLAVRSGFPTFVAFAWSVWFLTPGLRRIVDYEMGAWNPQNPMSLAPFLVTAIALVTVAQRLPALRQPRFWPWTVAALAVGYGAVVGLVEVGPLASLHGLMSWSVPLGFGLAIALRWREYPGISRTFANAVLCGTIVLSAYAIVQFIAPPKWDRLWVEGSGMRSVGIAFPFEMRVFSLVNAPLPLAVILMAGLFLFLAKRGAVRVIGASMATIGLLLTLVRSVWLASVVGFAIYLLALPVRYVRRVVVGVAVAAAAVLVIPAVITPSVSAAAGTVVQQRFLTLDALDQDISYSERTSFLDQMSTVVLNAPLGHGIGSTGVSSELAEGGDGIRDFDNGVLAALYTLGWVGGAGFLAALGVLALRGLFAPEARGDMIAAASAAIVFGCLALTVGGNVFDGVSGMVLWGFAGLLTASHHWHRALR